MIAPSVTPFFSVIIPVFNRAILVREALASVFGQTFRDSEVVVVNDGSTDETAEVLAAYGSHIRVIHQSNSGEGPARNAGIACARGAYSVFLDSDDLMFPWALETYWQAICSNSNPSVVMGTATYWRDRSEVDVVVRQPLSQERYPDYFSTWRNRFVRTAAVVAVKTQELQRVGGFSTKRMNTADHDLLYRLGDARLFVRVVGPPVIAYRQHLGSISRVAAMSHAGLVHQLEQERAGNYPGGERRRRERRDLILFSIRNSAWHFLGTGHFRFGWDLYRRSLMGNIRCGYIRFLLGFPIIAVLRTATAKRCHPSGA